VVGGIVLVHVDLRGGAELFRAEDGAGREQTEAGHNHESTRRLRWSGAERGRVGHFPPEIQTAHKRVDFAERGGAGTEFDGELEIGGVAGEDGVAASAGLRWRQKKDAGRRRRQRNGIDSLQLQDIMTAWNLS